MKLLSKYEEDEEGWWFNSSHDRYIAEKGYDDITANPQLAWRAGYDIVT